AIGHPGGWRTQVIFTEDGEDYTTKIIEFDVGGHLLDNKKPAIVDIENWNSFIAHAEELIDDWEQLEEIRQANETSRQANELVREEAENNRQSTFETNETERQTEFETNESERESTFETNESTRQANELTRESSESERVANEEERISKDSERDNKIEAAVGIVEDVSDRVDNKVDASELELYAKKEQEDWIEPTMLNGWRGLSNPIFQPVRYMK